MKRCYICDRRLWPWQETDRLVGMLIHSSHVLNEDRLDAAMIEDLQAKLKNLEGRGDGA